jgi:archaeosine-15-forming tRNA-guanine transglycosylase
MAIQFSKLRDPKLGLQDTITFGKLKGCRVCDVAQDHYEYLIWAEKQGYLKLQTEAIELIQEQASFARWKINETEEVAPYVTGNKHEYLAEIVSRQDYDTTFEEGDIPF